MSKINYFLFPFISSIFWLAQKTLIFDLDETLIHCNENINIPSDVILPIVFPTGEIIEVILNLLYYALLSNIILLQAGINVRPYAVQIL